MATVQIWGIHDPETTRILVTEDLLNFFNGLLLLFMRLLEPFENFLFSFFQFACFRIFLPNLDDFSSDLVILELSYFLCSLCHQLFLGLLYFLLFMLDL